MHKSISCYSKKKHHKDYAMLPKWLTANIETLSPSDESTASSDSDQIVHFQIEIESLLPTGTLG